MSKEDEKSEIDFNPIHMLRLVDEYRALDYKTQQRVFDFVVGWMLANADKKPAVVFFTGLKEALDPFTLE